MKRLKLYMSLVDNYTRAIGVVILFLACISAGLAAYWPVALGECYTAITEGNKNALVANLVAFVMALLLCELIGFARRVSTDCMLARQERQLRLLSLIKILRMPVAYHEQALSGECTARMNQGVAGFSQIIKLLCQDIFPAALTTVSVLMAVMYSAPTEFCVAMLLYAFMTTVISYFQIRSQRGIREKILGLKIRLDGEITQELQNFEQIRCCNADQEEAKRMYPDVKMIEKSEIRHHVTMGGYDSFKKILQISVIAVLLGMCFVLGQGGRFDVALSITVIMLFQQLAAPVDAVYRCMDEFSSSMVKVSVVGDLFAHKDDSHYQNQDREVHAGKPIAEVCNAVVLSPNGGIPISCPNNFQVNANERILLAGPTGSGKTSVIRAIMGYYPHAGTVCLYGNDVDTLRPAQIANTVLYVPQFTHFFQGSIKDNLMFGVGYVPSNEALVVALKKAFLWDELNEKNAAPLSFCVTEGAKNLSAG